MPNLDKDYYLDKSGVQTLISELETNIIADGYSSSATYAVGDYCIHDNKIYRCTTAISTAEAWDSTHWTLVVIGDELKSSSGSVSQVKVGTTTYDPVAGVVSLPAYPTTLPASDTTSTYSSTGTAPVNGTAVASALGTLDVTGASSISASKTISDWSETDGKVSISTQDISITKSQVSDFPSTMPPSSHTHGNIQNGGTLQTNDITIATGDKLVVTDSSDSNKIARTSASFDGSTTSKALTQKGTFETFLQSHQTVTDNNPTLAWGTKSKVATIGSTDINVTMPANPNTDTTYTFANGTNGFTVTPSGGTAQTVTVTPSITNNVTGSGTSGYLAKFNGANTITDAVALGSDTTKYLRNDGTWQVPTGTTYSQGTGISISGTTINHSNSVTAGTAGTSSATSGSTLAVPYVTYDAQGHITASGTHTHTVTGFATTDTKNTAGSTDTSSKIFLIGATSQAANPQTYSDNEVYVTNGTLTAGNAQATVLGVVPSNGTSGGISLYAGTGYVDTYGIAFRTTANMGKHGYIQGDWATYFTMNNADNRGWIFRRVTTGNVASISTQGNAVFNGSVTVGGNTTNTSGARIVYSASEQAINFEFL